MNTPIQGTAADIMKMAMIEVYRKMKAGGYKSRVLLQVHDELVAEVVKEEKGRNRSPSEGNHGVCGEAEGSSGG